MNVILFQSYLIPKIIKKKEPVDFQMGVPPAFPPGGRPCG